MFTFSPQQTALVLIDLQQGILPVVGGPYCAEKIIANTTAMAHACHQHGVQVVWVRVGWSDDFADAPHQTVDAPSRLTALPANWWHFPAALPVTDGDIHITKHQWGAFYGTDLDLQLRRRGIQTLILGGVSTNIGVESTARCAWEQGYQLIIPEDLCSAADQEQHNTSFRYIFPRIAHITRCEALLNHFASV